MEFNKDASNLQLAFFGALCENPATVSENQFPTVSIHRFISEKISGRVYSHPIKSQTLIRSALVVEKNIKRVLIVIPVE